MAAAADIQLRRCCNCAGLSTHPSLCSVGAGADASVLRRHLLARLEAASAELAHSANRAQCLRALRKEVEVLAGVASALEDQVRLSVCWVLACLWT